MTQPELNHHRKILENKRAELAHGSRSRGALAIEATADEMDQTQGLQERDLAIGTFDRDAKMLRDVRSALDRINAGTFGICLDCEYDISGKRLAAVPWAALCIACQEAADAASDAYGVRSEDSLAA
jgi:DnaK suppressor protein